MPVLAECPTGGVPNGQQNICANLCHGLKFFPAAALLGRAGDVPFTPLFAYGAPLIGLAVLAVGRLIWQIGLGHHQSTGS